MLNNASHAQILQKMFFHADFRATIKKFHIVSVFFLNAFNVWYKAQGEFRHSGLVVGHPLNEITHASNRKDLNTGIP
jgi:hypothetical protein